MEIMSDGSILVADQGNHRIRCISSDRKTITTFAGCGLGYADASLLASKFNYCISLCIDREDVVYVSDHMNHVIRVIKDGVVSTLAGKPNVLGHDDHEFNPREATFNSPAGIEFDLDGNLLVADGGNHCIRKVDIKNGKVTTVAGSPQNAGLVDGVATAAIAAQEGIEGLEVCKFHKPLLVTTDAAGNMFVSDYNNSKIRVVEKSGRVVTINCTNASGQSGVLRNPYNMTLDLDGNLIVADWANNRLKCIAAKASRPNYNLDRYLLHFSATETVRSHEEDLLELLHNAAKFHADFEFIVNGVSFPCHKGMLCVRSEYFRQVLSSGMRETFESRYEIKETTVEAFRGLLTYIYTDNKSFAHDIILDVMLLADRFLITGLSKYLEKQIKTSLSLKNAVAWFIWAEDHGVEWLKEATKKKIVTNFAVLREKHKEQMGLLISRPELMAEFFI